MDKPAQKILKNIWASRIAVQAFSASALTVHIPDHIEAVNGSTYS